MQRTTYYHVCAVHSGMSNRSERTVGVDEHKQNRDRQKVGFSLSQETITILTVGVALAGLMFVNQGHLHAEARAEREEMRADARADRARIEASMNQMRAEGRADREEMRAEGRASREAFEKQITRLVEQQGTLNGLVDGLRQPIVSPEE